MRSRTLYYLAFTAVALLAFALRVGAAMWWEARLPAGQKFDFPDSESYWQLGQRIARGEPYEFGEQRLQVFRTPGYPLILAGLFRLVGDNNPPQFYARCLGALLGAVSVGCVGWLGHSMFGPRTGLLASTLAAIHPEAIAPSVFVLSEAPFCPLMLLNLIGWIVASRCHCPKRMLTSASAAGIAAGLAVLMRPSWLLFLPFACVVGFVFCDARKQHLAIGGAMLAATCLTLSPWWVRNYGVAGRFVPTSLQVGASLYDGLNPQATGGSDMRFVHRFESETPLQPRETYEGRLDDAMRSASLAWTKDHPAQVLALAGNKFLRMWSVWPNAAEFRNPKLGFVLAAGFLPLMLAVGFGGWKFRSLGWPLFLCLLPAAYFTLLHMVFVSSIRYRQPALLPLMVVAAGGCAWLLRWPEVRPLVDTA